MLIGIDAHNLESGRGGAAYRYLFNLLTQWNKNALNAGARFILYFKKEIPQELDFLSADRFVKKALRAPFGIQSNALFTHWLLAAAAKKDNVDVLFSPYYVLPVFYKGKSAVTLHDIFYEVNPKAFDWPSRADRILLKWVSKRSAKKSRMIFTPSEFTKNEVIKHYRVDPEKMIVTPLGVEEKFSVSGEFAFGGQKPPVFDKQKIKEKYDIKNKFVFYVGSIFNRRHVPEAIDAFLQLDRKLSEYQFLIVGGNHTRPFIDIKKIVREVNNHYFHPLILYKEAVPDDDLALLYHAADLFIWLSDYEGFGLPVLEAQVAGTPLITSSKASLPEVAGDAAVFVRHSDNIFEIAAAVRSALFDESLRQGLIKRGFENVKRFSWERCAAETLKALTQK